jgi:hypothetical protein
VLGIVAVIFAPLVFVPAIASPRYALGRGIAIAAAAAAQFCFPRSGQAQPVPAAGF